MPVSKKHPKVAAAARVSAAIRAEQRRTARVEESARVLPEATARRRRATSSPDLPRRTTTVSMREDLRGKIQAEADARGWTFAAVLEEVLAGALETRELATVAAVATRGAS